MGNQFHFVRMRGFILLLDFLFIYPVFFYYHSGRLQDRWRYRLFTYHDTLSTRVFGDVRSSLPAYYCQLRALSFKLLHVYLIANQRHRSGLWLCYSMTIHHALSRNMKHQRVRKDFGNLQTIERWELQQVTRFSSYDSDKVQGHVLIKGNVSFFPSLTKVPQNFTKKYSLLLLL